MKRNKWILISKDGQGIEISGNILAFIILPMLIAFIIGGIIGNNQYEPVAEEKVENFKTIARVVRWKTEDVLGQYQDVSILLSPENVQNFLTTDSIKIDDYKDFEVLIENDLITVSDAELVVKVSFVDNLYQEEVTQLHSQLLNIIGGGVLGSIIVFVATLLIVVIICFVHDGLMQRKQSKQENEK